MRIGWRKFLSGKFRKGSPFYALGIEVSPGDARLSALKIHQGDVTWSMQQTFQGDDWAEQIKGFVKSHAMANTPTYVALSAGSYQLLQVDKPAVADDEINQALQWSIRDVISGSEELVVDYFDAPVTSAGVTKLNVIAAPKPVIKNIAQALFDADLPIAGISVADLATCELLPGADEAVMTLIQQAGQEICLNIVRNGQLFFTRRLKGYENLSNFSERELEMGVVDNLSVEVQRSMDFFESQLRQAPVKKILIGLDYAHQATLADLMQKLMFMPVEVLSPDVARSVDTDLKAASYTSLGAAMTHHNIQMMGSQS